MRTASSEYPKVLSEDETLDRVLAGASLARFGDGEFNHVEGRKNVSQKADEKLAAEIRLVLASPPKNCLVAIPTMNPKGPKYHFWQKYKSRYAAHLNPKYLYGSAFVTRPDSAPWINTREFFDKIESLWAGQHVTLVGNGQRSLTPEFLNHTAANVAFVQCSYTDSYDQIDDLERQCVALKRRVIICAGPTATCLAVRLARNGLHAIDLGHVGLFWRPYDNAKLNARLEQSK